MYHKFAAAQMHTFSASINLLQVYEVQNIAHPNITTYHPNKHIAHLNKYSFFSYA